MTPLRQQFIEELVLRDCAERTRESYVYQVYHLAKYYRQPPDQLSESYYCPHCEREHVVAHSCRNRHCPQCQGTQAAEWCSAPRISLKWEADCFSVMQEPPPEGPPPHC